MGSPHDGHRARMLAKLDEYGPQIFEDHELLEMLLFYSLPRVNTNEIAHRLIERFDGLGNVFKATEQELITVDGVGSKSAKMIKTVGAVMVRCAQKKVSKSARFKGIDDIGQYVMGLFEGADQEKLFAVFIDHSGRLIKSVCVAEGNVDSVELMPSIVLNNASKYRCTNVVLAHNHPRGLLKPSVEDILMTGRIRYALSVGGVTLIEHFTVTDEGYYPIMYKNKDDLAR